MITTDTDREKVELYLSCKKLKNLDGFSKSDPQVKLYHKVNDQWQLLNQTEVVKDNLNPLFKTTFLLDFIFETQQPLKFEVLDIDTPTTSQTLGIVETTLGAIMGARKQTLTQDLHYKEKFSGTLVVKGEKADENCNKVKMQWTGVKLMNTDGWFGKSDPFLRFFKIRSSGELLQVHETETVQDNLNPVWKPFKISDIKLGSSHSKTFKIECWDREKDGNHQFIGECEATLDMLKDGATEFELENSKKKSSVGKLHLSEFSIEYKKYTFIDYLKEGTQLNVAVAIDFTYSNGEPKHPNSLHRLTGTPPNEYHQAISSICPIILNYDSDGTVPVYGFGGVPPFSKEVLHCFSLTGDPNKPEVNGLAGVLDAYRKSITNVAFSGPTYFNPILQETSKLCRNIKERRLDQYVVLLILTDGVINDMKETAEALVKAYDLPLSVIIVGVGQKNFAEMNKLDGDTNASAAATNQTKRDIVQFVPFRDCKNDPKKLAEMVLAEIPRQLVQYMEQYKPKGQNAEALAAMFGAVKVNIK